MRIFARPVAFIALLVLCTAVVQSQEGGGNNYAPPGNVLAFQQGSPSATTGGVDVGLTVSAATGYTCTSVTISVVDSKGNTLATTTVNNPGGSITQNFTGLGSGINVTVVVNSVFQAQNQFDYPYAEGIATTK